VSTTVKAEQLAWHEKNPLRKWRRENDMPIMATASQLRVSMTIVQLWENGVHVPSPENMAKIVGLIGPTAERRWKTWLKARP
jgi:DNA-binding transcriptional regulator YiaG